MKELVTWWQVTTEYRASCNQDSLRWVNRLMGAVNHFFRRRWCVDTEANIGSNPVTLEKAYSLTDKTRLVMSTSSDSILICFMV